MSPAAAPFSELHATPTSRSSTAPRPRRTWWSGLSSWASRPGGDRPPGSLRRGPFRERGPGGRAAAGGRHGGRAARCRGPGPGWGRGAPSAPSTPRVAGPGGRGWPAERVVSAAGVATAPGIARHRRGLGRRGSAGPPQRRATAAARPPRAAARGPARVRDRERGPHLVLLARDLTGYRSLCRLVSAAHLAGTKGVPRFTHELLAEHAEGLVALTGCRHGELARRLLAGDRPAPRGGASPGGALCPGERPRSGSSWSSSTTSCPTTTCWSPRLARLADRARAADPRHQRRPLRAAEDRELQDVLVAIRHGLTLDESAAPAPPNGEYHLKSASGAGVRLPPAGCRGRGSARGTRLGRGAAHGRGARRALHASTCEFERYRFPGFAVPDGETPFSELARLCHEGARHALPPASRQRVVQAAGARAGGHRADRSGRVLPHLLGPHALRPRARHPGPGSGQRRRFDRRLRAGHHPRRPHPPRPAVRALHQRGPDQPTRTSTSTSPRPAGRRSSSTSTRRTARSTRAWSATWSPTGRARRCARWATRWASRGRSSTGWPRRSRPTTRSWSGGTWRRRAASPSSSSPRRERTAATVGQARPPGIDAAAAVAGERGLVDGMGELAHARDVRRRTGLGWSGVASGGPGERPVPREARRSPGPAAAGIHGPGPRRGGHAGRCPSATSCRAPSAADRSSPTRSSSRPSAWRPWTTLRPALGRRGRTGRLARQRALAAGEAAAVDRHPASDLSGHASTAGAIDPETGVLLTDPSDGRIASADRMPGIRPRRRRRRSVAAAAVPRATPASLASSPSRRRMPRGGSTVGLSPWERWLELCARIDGFPRHLSHPRRRDAHHRGRRWWTSRRWSAPRCPAASSSSTTSATSRR